MGKQVSFQEMKALLKASGLTLTEYACDSCDFGATEMNGCTDPDIGKCEKCSSGILRKVV